MTAPQAAAIPTYWVLAAALCKDNLVLRASVDTERFTQVVLATDHAQALAQREAEVWKRVTEKARQADTDSADPKWILEWAEQQAQDAGAQHAKGV